MNLAFLFYVYRLRGLDPTLVRVNGKCLLYWLYDAYSVHAHTNLQRDSAGPRCGMCELGADSPLRSALAKQGLMEHAEPPSP